MSNSFSRKAIGNGFINCNTLSNNMESFYNIQDDYDLDAIEIDYPEDDDWDQEYEDWLDHQDWIEQMDYD